MSDQQRTDRIVSLADLKPTDWQRLLEITDRFEKAWPASATAEDDVDLTTFLPTPDDSLRPVVLQELIKTDLEIRWRRGQKPNLDQYLERFPELGAAEALPAKLIYEEYRVRQLYGDHPPLAMFQTRFPKQFAGLQQLVEEQPPPTLTNIAATPSSTEKPAEAVTPKAGTLRMTVVGDNKLMQRIGSGGFGEVYRAEAPGGVEVAVKVIYRPMDHEEAQRELQSLELVKRLRHPYLLQTHRFSQQEDRLYIVMELADRSLRDRLRECRQQGKTGIPLDELLPYFREAAEAIDFLHAQRVMHRDIKPENILLVGRHVKVADFGLARLQQSQRSATASGSGTPAYMAPEVWRGKVSGHSDQYSLAVAYVEMRIDRRPFAGGDMMELMLSHVQNKPDLTPIPPHEAEVLYRALAKEPTQRYANCIEFVQALEEAIIQDGGGAALDTERIRAATTARKAADAATLAGLSGGVLPTPDSARDRSATLSDDSNAFKRVPEPTHDTMLDKQAWSSAAAGSAASPAAPAPQRRRWSRVAVVAGIALVGGAALAALFFSRGRNGKQVTAVTAASFALEKPETLRVRAGDEAQIVFAINRAGFDGPVEITTTKPVAKVGKVSGLIPAGASSVPITLSVERDAAPGKYDIAIQAVGSGIKQDGTLQIIVEAPDIYLPQTLKDQGHWEAVSTKPPLSYRDRLYNWEIAFIFKDGKTRIPFVLIPPGDDALPPFYISMFKISNGAYARFFAAQGTSLQLSEDWKDGTFINSAKTGIKGRDDYPVYGVHVEEAYLFAQWLGGDLPTPDEWDKAAGAHRDPRNRGDGPFQGKWDDNAKEPGIAVKRDTTGPLPNGAATRDKSAYGVSDMSGNGQEWTGRIASLSNVRSVPLPHEARKDGVRVMLRSRSFLDPAPFLFSDIGDDRKLGSQDYLQSSPDTSFRVVLEPVPVSRN